MEKRLPELRIDIEKRNEMSHEKTSVRARLLITSALPERTRGVRQTIRALFQQITKILPRLPNYLLARRIDHGKLIFPFIGPGCVDDHARVGEVPLFRCSGVSRGSAGVLRMRQQDIH